MMIQAGLEPATIRLEGVCSIRIELLNQRRKKCRERESNSYEPKARRILSPVRLPVPPSLLFIKEKN